MKSSRRRAPRELDDEVAEIVRRSHNPLSAYDIVTQFAKRRERVVPTQVYRCLDRLMDCGAIRRIESLRAFCGGGDEHDAIAYCEKCGAHSTIMVEEAWDSIEQAARDHGYGELKPIIEVRGRCRNCQTAPMGGDGHK